MSIISKIIEWLGRGKRVTLLGPDPPDDYTADMSVFYLALWSAINLVANALGKCEFKTYRNGAEVKDEEYYLWNVSPNVNQNSTVFLRKIIAALYLNNDCLVIEQNGQLLVADSFCETPYALYENRYDGVTIGDFTFRKTFTESEVLRFRLGERNMSTVAARLFDSYSRLIDSGMESFRKSRGTKGVLSYNASPMVGEKKDAISSIINTDIKNWVKSENGALALGAGQKWEDFSRSDKETTRDIRAMIDDVSDLVAKALSIPPALLRGDVEGTADATDQFLTFALDPLADMMSEEINRKRYSRKAFLNGSFLRIDTKTIKHVDLLSLASSIDKLIASGVLNVNEVRGLIDLQSIDKPWADEHFITKNYAPFEDILRAADTSKKG